MRAGMTLLASEKLKPLMDSSSSALVIDLDAAARARGRDRLGDQKESVKGVVRNEGAC